ncbi:hypothetical protein [Siphonobacter sp. SORGH_AS_1065]|uniref:hypothetical protein n=1 Tax=Siphonobacter sp. SORGH_AS_1065 TaxID=3041795 RepID=UPI00277E2637|nr:hypothetical protein [Siphonobacter sp. SORGH_AS_1065]MDQ1087327.1 hypothetical protein [Siphonobacter sp. SORGH_AS_1065]
MKRTYWLYLPLLALVTLSSCKKDNKDPEPDENELITTVELTLKAGNETAKVFTWNDPDGDGGNAPVITPISLDKGKTYTYSLRFLDESKSPIEDITEEIQEKKDEHLVIFTPTPSSLLTVTITDKDSKNLNVGLAGTIQTQSSAGTGKLKIQLRHQPGTKDGTATPGSDDANIDFDVEIK